MKNKSTILILGATGMLGHALYNFLSKESNLRVFGTIRNEDSLILFSKAQAKNIITGVDAQNFDTVFAALTKIKPQIVINCIGIIKHISLADEVLKTVPINTLFPHHLAIATKKMNARLILVSTDCVFSGEKGNYAESDPADCKTVYGISKYLGEISNQKNILTIRTSIIGHELRGGHSLVNWFLNQKDVATGYDNAIYSGLPTIELAHIIRDLIIPNNTLWGLYHIASKPISKFDLLALIAQIYGKKIKLKKSIAPNINRSLNCNKFKKVTGYKPKTWKRLITEMHSNFQANYLS